MTIAYCDVCGKNCSCSEENLFGSRTFFFKNANSDSPVGIELTLCVNCKEQLFYWMKNHESFKRECNNMRLANRIRFLFKLPIKEG